MRKRVADLQLVYKMLKTNTVDDVVGDNRLRHSEC
jgi:hypothetical protein